MESQEETAVLLIYDHDNSLTKRHTEGLLRQRPFETPYAANLRTLIPLQAHFQRLRACAEPRVIFGAATFGGFRERIEGSWQALGFDPDSVLICAKFILPEVAALQGKNEHVIDVIQQHYARNPQVKIVRVILVDDDPQNIRLLKELKGDKRFDFPMEGILVPKPELNFHCVKTTGKYPKQVIATHLDDQLQIEVTTESAESERRFMRLLTTIEEKLKPRNLYTLFRDLAFQFPLPKVSEKHLMLNRLTRSFDDTTFFGPSRGPRKILASIGNSSDSWRTSSCESVSDVEGGENLSDSERRRLYESGP